MKLLVILLALASTTAQAECRSAKTVRLFNALHGFTRNPPNTVVDHICPLSVGGLDIIGNMQYQSRSEAKLKDTWELTEKGRLALCNDTNSKPYRTVFNCKD